MKLDRVELRRLEMPLVRPFRTSFGLQTDRDVLLVTVYDTDGVPGYGECVALSDPVYSSEFVAAAEQVVQRYLAPVLLATPQLTAPRVAPTLAASSRPWMPSAPPSLPLP